MDILWLHSNWFPGLSHICLVYARSQTLSTYTNEAIDNSNYLNSQLNASSNLQEVCELFESMFSELQLTCKLSLMIIEGN